MARRKDSPLTPKTPNTEWDIHFKIEYPLSLLLRVYLSTKGAISAPDFFRRYTLITVISDDRVKAAFPVEVEALTQSLFPAPSAEDRVLSVAEELEAAAVERRRKTDAEIDIIEEQIKRSHKVNPGSVPYEDPRKKKVGRGADSKGALGL